MKKIYLFFINILLLTLPITAQQDSFYVFLPDASGVDRTAAQARLEAAAMAIAKTFPEVDIQNKFQVFDAGMYLLNEKMEGGNAAIFEKLKATAAAASPYYLLFGKESNPFGIYDEFWVDMKLPEIDQYPCFEEILMEELGKLIQKETRNVHLANDKNPFKFYQAEIAAMEKLQRYLDRYINCCGVTEPTSECSLCPLETEDEVAILEGRGMLEFTGDHMSFNITRKSYDNPDLLTDFSIEINNTYGDDEYQWNFTDELQQLLNKIDGAKASVLYFNETNCDQFNNYLNGSYPVEESSGRNNNDTTFFEEVIILERGGEKRVFFKFNGSDQSEASILWSMQHLALGKRGGLFHMGACLEAEQCFSGNSDYLSTWQYSKIFDNNWDFFKASWDAATGSLGQYGWSYPFSKAWGDLLLTGIGGRSKTDIQDLQNSAGTENISELTLYSDLIPKVYVKYDPSPDAANVGRTVFEGCAAGVSMDKELLVDNGDWIPKKKIDCYKDEHTYFLTTYGPLIKLHNYDKIKEFRIVNGYLKAVKDNDDRIYTVNSYLNTREGGVKVSTYSPRIADLSNLMELEDPNGKKYFSVPLENRLSSYQKKCEKALDKMVAVKLDADGTKSFYCTPCQETCDDETIKQFVNDELINTKAKKFIQERCKSLAKYPHLQDIYFNIAKAIDELIRLNVKLTDEKIDTDLIGYIGEEDFERYNDQQKAQIEFQNRVLEVLDKLIEIGDRDKLYAFLFKRYFDDNCSLFKNMSASQRVEVLSLLANGDLRSASIFNNAPKEEEIVLKVLKTAEEKGKEHITSLLDSMKLKPNLIKNIFFGVKDWIGDANFTDLMKVLNRLAIIKEDIFSDKINIDDSDRIQNGFVWKKGVFNGQQEGITYYEDLAIGSNGNISFKHYFCETEVEQTYTIKGDPYTIYKCTKYSNAITPNLDPFAPVLITFESSQNFLDCTNYEDCNFNHRVVPAIFLAFMIEKHEDQQTINAIKAGVLGVTIAATGGGIAAYPGLVAGLPLLLRKAATRCAVGVAIDIAIQSGINSYLGKDALDINGASTVTSCLESVFDRPDNQAWNLMMTAGLNCAVSGNFDNATLRDEFSIEECAKGAVIAATINMVFYTGGKLVTTLRQLDEGIVMEFFTKIANDFKSKFPDFGNSIPTLSCGFATTTFFYKSFNFFNGETCLPWKLWRHYNGGDLPGEKQLREILKIDDKNVATQLVNALGKNDEKLVKELFESGFFQLIAKANITRSQRAILIKDLIDNQDTFLATLRQQENKFDDIIKIWDVLSDMSKEIRHNVSLINYLSTRLDEIPAVRQALLEVSNQKKLIDNIDKKSFLHNVSSGAIIYSHLQPGTYLIGSFPPDLQHVLQQLNYPKMDPLNLNFPIPIGQKFNLLNVSDAVYETYINAIKGFFRSVNGPWVDNAVMQKVPIIVVSDVDKYIYKIDSGIEKLTGFGKEVHRLEWIHNYRYDPLTKRMLPPNKSINLPRITREMDYDHGL